MKLFIAALPVLLIAGCAIGSRRERQEAFRAEKVESANFRYDGTNAQGYDEYLRVKDGARMVFVPGGTYPRRPYEGTALLLEPEEAQVPGYLIDKFEVTNGQFARFLNETGRGPLHTDAMKRRFTVFVENPWGIRRADGEEGERWEPQPGYADHPVVGATGLGAQLYAEWAGADLPDPDQWMKAAGGPEGRLFACASPAGEVDPEKFPSAACNWYGTGLFSTAPVGSFPDCVSPVGCYDMAGNVYERVKAPGPRMGRPEMIKGGSWVTAHPLNLRVHDLCMQPMPAAERSVGFRCVVPASGIPRIMPADRRPAPVPESRPVAPPLSSLPPPAGLLLPRGFAEGREEARQRNCPILLTLHYDTCGGCDRVRSQVFSDPAFIAFANEACVVVVGQAPHDAGNRPHRKAADGRCALWPALRCADHEAIFEEAADLAGGFRMSPGNYLLTPHAPLEGPPEPRILVGEMEFQKTGAGPDAYARKVREAQEILGPGLARSRWKAVSAAIRDLADGKPGAADALEELVEGLDPEIPIAADARKLLSAASQAK